MQNLTVSEEVNEFDDIADREFIIAQDTLESLLADLPRVQDESDVTSVGVIYSLWLHISHALFDAGFDSVALANELASHEAIHHGQSDTN